MIKFKRYKLRLSSIAFSILLLCHPLSAADKAFQFSLQRMTYDEGKNSISLGLRNNENSAYLVQAGMKWLDETSGLQLLDKKENTPFIITPLLEKIEPGEYYDWQIKFTGADNLPTDRETLYIAQFRLIPATSPDTETMQMNIIRALNFKVYYRPKALQGIKINNSEDKLSFSVNGNTLIATNQSPIYLALNSIKVNGKEIDPQQLSKNVPPFGKQTYIFSGEKVKDIRWQVLDEYLFPLDEKSILIK